ncbi:hypothetical protein Psfp_01079 [Pelotomaculum sp. FP]|uniref:hypothetical protein n=1 Tax=Pelotomaculum sp. FP TaxID=261474 RepID=UPI0010670863|nr:hypothetical protein [Pelotomaculum sp. FP]TEB16678.1 hypothetical protein Psfp_01079 [Pelotomaculum sp. FP]
MSDDLADFLRGKKQLLQKGLEEKRNDIKELCPSGIKSFFQCLEDWLSDLIEEQMISTSYEVVTVNKQKSGAYKTKRFKLKTGEDEIEFIPNGRTIVGATGKIEMKTKKGNIFFIRDRDGIWKQVISRTPFNVETLTKPYFRGLLKSVLS